MRNVLAGIVCLLAAGSLFAESNVSTCSQANLLVSGIQGEMAAPCTGALDFTSASFTAPSSGGGGQYGGGGGGASTPGTLKVTRYFDKASPGLMLACSNGKHIQQVKLSYPSGQTPVTITFQDVLITAVNESFNPTNESVDFKAAKVTVESGGNKVTTSVMGTARAGSLSVSAVNGDGQSQPVSRLTLTVRPTGTTFNSIELAPSAPGTASRATLKQAPVAGAVTSVAAAPGAVAGAPTESFSLNYGKIVFKYQNQNSDFNFTGGTLQGNLLHVQKVNFGSNIAVHP